MESNFLNCGLFDTLCIHYCRTTLCENKYFVKVLGVALELFADCFPCSCSVPSPGSPGGVTFLQLWLVTVTPAAYLLLINWLFSKCGLCYLPFCWRFRSCSTFSLLKVTKPPSFGEGTSRIFALSVFSPLHSRLLLVSINPFMSPSWLLPSAFGS